MPLRNVLPTPPLHDVANHRAGDAKLTPESNVCLAPTTVTAANLSHFGLSDLCVRARLAGRAALPSSIDCIRVVVSRSACVEVVRSHALSVVAVMADEASGWDEPKVQLVGHAMREKTFAAAFDRPVTADIVAASPLPAAFTLSDVSPESNQKRRPNTVGVSARFPVGNIWSYRECSAAPHTSLSDWHGGNIT